MSPVSQYFILSISEYWSQKRTQNGSIHSAKLDVYAEKQSKSNLSFILSQHKQGKKLTGHLSGEKADHLVTRLNFW